TWQVGIFGEKHKPSNYSQCADLKDARLWNSHYWCPSSVGVLSADQVASLGGSTGTTKPPVTVPAPTPTPTSYTAKLSWTAPSTREDGKPLAMSELKGYEIYYTSDDLNQSVTVPVSGGTKTSHSVPNLKPGTYHFAISAI